MMVPSSNILNLALTAIAPAPFVYRAYNGRNKNGVGLYVPLYAEPVTLKGSIQAVNKQVYQNLGLDYTKNYVSVFVSADLIDLGRNQSGSIIEWQGKAWQLTSETDWFKIDGWVKVLAVEVPQPVVVP